MKLFDNQKYRQARKLLRKNMQSRSDEDFVEKFEIFVKKYTSIRFQQGKKVLSESKYQYKRIHQHLEKAKESIEEGEKNTASIHISKAAKIFNNISENQLLDAQRKLEQARNVAQQYSISEKLVEVTGKDIEEIREMDKELEEIREEVIAIRREIE